MRLARIVIAVAAFNAYLVAHGAEKGLQVGSAVGNISGKDTKGKVVKLARFKGKVVLLNFGATWWPACNDDAPVVERDFWKKYKSMGLQVIGVNSFEDEKPQERARLFARKHKLTYPVLVDTGDKIATAFGFSGLPSQVVIDRKGVVQYRDEGDFKAAKLKETIERLLK